MMNYSGNALPGVALNSPSAQPNVRATQLVHDGTMITPLLIPQKAQKAQVPAGQFTNTVGKL